MSYFRHTKHAYLVLLALFGILFFIIVVGCYFNIRRRRRQIKAKKRAQEKKKKKVKSDKQVLTEEDELEQNHVDTIATDQQQPSVYTPQEKGTIELNNHVSSAGS
ncbi:hypothetical protein HOLleu_14809 [Holothuria leucospilota]|uniref:Uncharacterized protein n=1 Tax=Holothuria leucospilota TaxID=206669 RepID=A0A9Q1C849_HOLLE|nr:hypothetical protein HOLleu_14809 [Holothuria leucospilota]